MCLSRFRPYYKVLLSYSATPHGQQRTRRPDEYIYRFGSRTYNIDFRRDKGQVLQFCLITGYDFLGDIRQMGCRCGGQSMFAEKDFVGCFHSNDNQKIFIHRSSDMPSHEWMM